MVSWYFIGVSVTAWASTLRRHDSSYCEGEGSQYDLLPHDILVDMLRIVNAAAVFLLILRGKTNYKPKETT